MSRLDAHYDAVIEAREYDRIDVPLGDAPASELRRRFAAVDGRDALANALERPTIVTTGVGVNGPPHLGTVGQFRNAIRLQELGLDVQFVLADLESYHGGGDLAELRRRTERFRAFALDLGFDPDRGRLRSQEEARDVMHTANLLARYYDPGDEGYGPETEPTAWDAAVREMYEEADSGFSGPSSEAASHHSRMLHVADFLHPLLKGGYEQVLIALGIDEHGLTVATRRFLEDSPVEGTIAGLHTRMITGVGDYPKMGRSAPGSGVTLDMDPAAIETLLLDPANDDADPSASLVFQAMCLAGEYEGDELDHLEALCEADDVAWREAKERFAMDVVDLAERWSRTAEV